MSNDPFAAGYLAGGEHRTVTAVDRTTEGDWSPDDAYLRCPVRHVEPTPDCDWCSGWASAWE